MDSTFIFDDENVIIINLEPINKRELRNHGEFYQKFFIYNKSNYKINVILKNFTINGRRIFEKRYIAEEVKPKTKKIGEGYITLYDVANFVEKFPDDFISYSFSISYNINGIEVESERIEELAISGYED